MADNAHRQTLEQRIRELEKELAAQQRAKEFLESSEKKNRALFETLTLGIVYQDKDGRIISANPAALSILGMTLKEMQNRTSTDPRWNAIHEDGRAFPGEKHPSLTALRTAKKIGDVVMGVFNPQKNKHVWINVNAIPLFESGLQSPVQVYTVFQDISEKVKIRKALSKSEIKYRDLVETIPYGIQEIGLDGRILFCNDAYHRMLGYESGELIGTHIWDHATSPDGAEKLKSYLKHLIQVQPKPEIYHEKKRCRDGRIIDVHVDWNYKYNPSNKLEGFIAVITNVTEQEKAHKALEESEAKYRTLFEMESDAIFLIEKETGNILEVNSSASMSYGYSREEFLKMKNTDVSAEPEKTAKATHDKLIDIPLRFHKKKNGRMFPVEITASHVTWQGKEAHIAAIRDISFRIENENERSELLRQLNQAKKMESIGTLAGGIAHDFNNLMAGILGRTSLMSVDMDASHPHAEHIRAIGEYIQSATDLTRQLLGFARGGKYEVRPVDINELIRNSSAMFGRTRKEIRVHTNLQKQPLVVEADRRQIEQVLLNMYVNAWQAMPAGGELFLETGIVALDETSCKPHQLSPGRYGNISITDTGCGMDDATLQRIFDPFFTTKEKSFGSGLGLSSAYGIIKNHGGMIVVSSRVGQGTTFNIYLPVTEKDAYQETTVKESLIRGSETILLVDDENIILEVGQAMLEKLGYRVIIAKGGRQAVEVVAARGNTIDLIILDLIMPGMDGGKAFDRIREMRPALPVILSSGYAIDGYADKIMQRGCNGFIQKPFNLSELSKKIRTILDEPKE